MHTQQTGGPHLAIHLQPLLGSHRPQAHDQLVHLHTQPLQYITLGSIQPTIASLQHAAWTTRAQLGGPIISRLLDMYQILFRAASAGP